MQYLEIEEITEQKINGIENMLQQLILDSLLAALRRIFDSHLQESQSICYKTNCSMRDNIPF